MGVASKVVKAVGKAAKKAPKAVPKKAPLRMKPKGSAAKPGKGLAKPKRVAPKPKMNLAGTNAVGMRFDMGAGASAGSSAPVNYVPGKAGSSKPAKGRAMTKKAAGARLGNSSALGMIPVTPYKPVLGAKLQRKVGAAMGASAITGGMVATAEQKEKALVRAARQGVRSRK